MGRIKTADIKKAAFALKEQYPEKFDEEFQKNKEALKEMDILESKKNRNKTAGYITRIVKRENREKKRKK